MTGKRQNSSYDSADNYIVIYWHNGDTITKWNEHMAWVTEQFGLPGREWSADVTAEGMTIRFNNKNDAMMARLKFGL